MRVPSVLYWDVPRIGNGEMTDFSNPSLPCISTHVQGFNIAGQCPIVRVGTCPISKTMV